MSVGFCCCLRQPHEWSRYAAGWSRQEPHSLSPAHLAHKVFRCYLRVLIMSLEKTISQYIPYFNAFGNSGIVFLFENLGGFVCWDLYRVQLNAKNILLRKEFYFRKWLLNWNKRKIISKRSQFLNLSTFLITFLVVTLLFRIDRSQFRVSQWGLLKDVIMSLLHQVFNFKQDESRIWCFFY